MASISDLNQEKSRYQYLYNDLSTLAGRIDNGASNLDTAIAKVGDYYSVDNQSYDYGRIKNIKSELIAKSEEIRNTIMPAINSKISSINSEIARIEEEERRRAEEARRALEEEQARQAAEQAQAAIEKAQKAQPVKPSYSYTSMN